MTDGTNAWGTCTLCGDAMPPTAASCPTCGHPAPARSLGVQVLPPRSRSRLRLVQSLRGLIIVGAAVGLSYLMVSAAFTPPPVAADPLTTRAVWTIAPGGFASLAGSVTGADYIVGNYTVVNPPGAPITLLVFNETDFAAFSLHRAAVPLYNVTGDSSARLIFSAPYTDTYHFVWVNGFAPTTGLVLSVYVVTNYESNALVE
ncbi:MAG: hypothetical protein L3J93_03395 [Thermoplasmata archaeon]|nr:hypothetical protein [Thermoplasmata archaeon]